MPAAPRAGAFGIGTPSGATFCTWVSTNESESLPATHPVMVTTDPFIVGSGWAAPAIEARPRPRARPPPTSKFFIGCLHGVDGACGRSRRATPLLAAEQDAGHRLGADARRTAPSVSSWTDSR